VPGQTPRDQPEGRLALPGDYTIELSVGGLRDRQILTVRPDPRVNASAADLTAQSSLATHLEDVLALTYDGFAVLRGMRSTIVDRVKALSDGRDAKNAKRMLEAIEKTIDQVQNGTTTAPGLGLVNRDVARLYQMVLSGDARPSERLQASFAESCQALTNAVDAWRRLDGTELPGVNRTLARMKLSPVGEAIAPATPSCAP